MGTLYADLFGEASGRPLSPSSVTRLLKWQNRRIIKQQLFGEREDVVDDKICYLNTDLDLTSSEDLTTLLAIFESRGVFQLHVTQGKDGLWHATLETEYQHPDPEANIAAMISAVESLGEPYLSLWFGCTSREFNIGYDCGTEPWAFNQSLSCELLGRMAAMGSGLRFTLYPKSHQGTAKLTGTS